MNRIRAAVLACATSLALSSSLALAQPATRSGWSLEWQAPDGCPSASAVRTEVRSLLEGSTRSGELLSITGVVVEKPHGFQVELRFDSEQGAGHRVLTGRACKEASKAAALVIALAIDPGVKIDPNRQSALEAPPEQEPESAQIVEPPAPKSGEPQEEPSSLTPAEQKESLALSVEVALGPTLELGTLPQLGIGVHGGFSVGVGDFRGTIVGNWFPPRTYDADQATRLRLHLFTGSLLLGYAIQLGRHTMTPELGMRVGQLSGTATDAAIPSSADSLLLGPQLGLRGTFRTPGLFGLWAGLAGGVNLQRPRLLVENRGLAHQPSRTWGALALGVSLHWP